MDNSKMKNMIVLKNLPSNIVEEAIVILKQNKKIKSRKYVNCAKKGEMQKENKEYIVKEAEIVISDYISKIEKKHRYVNENVKKLQEKNRKLKNAVIILSMALVICVII